MPGLTRWHRNFVDARGDGERVAKECGGLQSLPDAHWKSTSMLHIIQEVFRGGVHTVEEYLTGGHFIGRGIPQDVIPPPSTSSHSRPISPEEIVIHVIVS